MHNPVPVNLFLVFIIFLIIPAAYATSISSHTLSPGDVTGDLSYSDTLMTNGGILAVNKNVGFDSQNQTASGYNLETGKILTYSGREGSHLSGEEFYMFDITGSSKPENEGYIRCIFTSEGISWLPAFCNIVETKTSLINVNSARVSEQGNMRMIGEEHTPAELNYRVAVTPYTAGGRSTAEGTVKTEFCGSVMESRDNSTNVSGINKWKDATEVSGVLASLKKNYEYRSGFRL